MPISSLDALSKTSWTSTSPCSALTHSSLHSSRPLPKEGRGKLAQQRFPLPTWGEVVMPKRSGGGRVMAEQGEEDKTLSLTPSKTQNINIHRTFHLPTPVTLRDFKGT